MTSIRKLASALCWATFFSFSNAAADTTGELINNNNWSGATYGADPGGCCASVSGSGALYDTTTDTIMFSYGFDVLSQTIALQQALGGTGIQVSGYNYRWDYRHIQNGTNVHTDQLFFDVSLKNNVGDVVENDRYDLSASTAGWGADPQWVTHSGSRNFAQSYTDPLSITMTISGGDAGFWGGYYGPEVRNVSLTVNYTFDPCAADPLYSTTCPGYAEAFKNQQCGLNPLYDTTCTGYNEVVASGNLVPRPGGQTGFWGGSLNNSFAISTALSHGGAGLMVHGFQWGYRATNYSVFGSSVGSTTVNVNIRDGDGTSLHTWSRNNTTAGTRNYSSSYILPESINNLDMGNFNFTATSTGFGMVDNMWARALITPDSCTLDPLSNVLCSGYAAAFLEQQCSLNTLYSPSCPGYQEAFAALLAAATPEADSTVSAENPVIAETTATPVAEDPTKDPAEVTTDVGGAELSADGTLSVSDGVPSEAKESAKSENKKKSLSIAQNAARNAERTAVAAASAAVEASLDENANPEDGIGLGDLGGVSLPGLQILQGDNSQVEQAALGSNPRNQNNKEETETVTVSTETESEAVDLGKELAVTETKEETAKAGPSVRRGGAVEGMDGGADIADLGKVPMDFNQYLDKQITDAQFYASRDIYRGQVNVDNARALRGLGTDRLHQQMVDQQYNIGN